MKERDYLNYLLLVLNHPDSSYRFTRINSGKWKVDGDRWVKGAPAGFADLVGFHRSGLYIELEIKMPRTRVTPKQKQRQKAVRNLGGIYEVHRFDKSLSPNENAEKSRRMLDAVIAERSD